MNALDERPQPSCDARPAGARALVSARRAASSPLANVAADAAAEAASRSAADARAATFQACRMRLFRRGYRMLGSRADAEDVLQEAYVRWHQTPIDAVQSPIAFLLTVATHLCLDRLRERRQQRDYVESSSPETMAVVVTYPSADMRLEANDDAAEAFVAVLERLGAEERAGFLLHDVFDFGYPELARIMDKAEPACRQLIHRARGHLRNAAPRFAVTGPVRARLVPRFLAAMESCDRRAILALLADAAACLDGREWRSPRADAIAQRSRRWPASLHGEQGGSSGCHNFRPRAV